jgi:excisionase family DNA binding protein
MPNEPLTIEPTRVQLRLEPLLLRRVDAAHVLGLSPRKLDNLARDGLLPKCRIGGLVRFHIDDLRQFAASLRENGCAARTRPAKSLGG